MSALDVALGSERLLWRLRHRPLDAVLLALSPFLLLLLAAFLVRSSTPVIGIVVQDQGPLGRQIAQALLSSNNVRLIDASTADLDRQIKEGSLDGLIVFPPTFTRTALAGQALKPEIHVAAAAPHSADDLVGSFARALLISAGTTGAHLDAQVTRIGATGAGPVDYTLAGVLAVAIVGFAFLLPFVAMDARPWQPFLVMVGSIVGCVLIALMVSLLLFIVYLLLGFHNVGGTALVILVEFVSVVAAASAGIILAQARLDAVRLAWILPLVVAPLTLFSGLVLPLNAQPGGAQLLAHLLPLTASVDALRGVMLRADGLGSSTLQRDLASLVGFVLLAFGVVFALSQRRQADGETR